ncbi:hypothetical protein I7I50_08665 [Histoplasma capsulatum G186AR]|uniref:Uncharacterized protein n=1 Tax=Ajellomyces capsulatus TaxID=5037 RepID=A0A8H8CZS6_AJECA|nr:hypothetical protein I7I52_06180 [Histoplasma capsulatum]QSS73770.1 hypothetical protein I7I50_08665 [Histoplasma capsulatum G186AR]
MVIRRGLDLSYTFIFRKSGKTHTIVSFFLQSHLVARYGQRSYVCLDTAYAAMISPPDIDRPQQLPMGDTHLGTGRQKSSRANILTRACCGGNAQAVCFQPGTASSPLLQRGVCFSASSHGHSQFRFRQLLATRSHRPLPERA